MTERPLDVLDAASLHAFAAAGFRRAGEGSEFLELEWP